MADFETGSTKTAVAKFMDRAGDEAKVEGDISWTVVPAGAVTFDGPTGPELRMPMTMGAPGVGIVVSAMADKNLNPDINDPLTISSLPFNIMVEGAVGGEVVFEDMGF